MANNGDQSKDGLVPAEGGGPEITYKVTSADIAVFRGYFEQLSSLDFDLKESVYVTMEAYLENEEKLEQNGFSLAAKVEYQEGPNPEEASREEASRICNQKLEEAKINGWKYVSIGLPYGRGYTLWIKKPAAENVEEG